MKTYKIAFAGTGIIGSGLAVNAILAGNKVSLYDVISVENVQKNIMDIMDIMVRLGAVERNQAELLMKDVVITNDLREAVNGVDYVQ